jgi:hypothetical protein
LLASVIIIIVSAGLFVYWFRWTCVLLLAQRSGAEYASKVTSTIRLNFPQVQAALLESAQIASLKRVHDGLENDLRILTDLLGQSGNESIEHRILAIDYKLMQAWYKATSAAGNVSMAKFALGEMSAIMGYFADALGQNASA